MTDYIQVVTTMADPAAAKRLAELLVEARLAGCVQLIGPMTSVYRWQGKVQSEAETLVLIKSRHDQFPALADFIAAHHPYEVPEILAVPVVAGGKSYLHWLAGELRD